MPDRSIHQNAQGQNTRRLRSRDWKAPKCKPNKKVAANLEARLNGYDKLIAGSRNPRAFTRPGSTNTKGK